MGFKLPGVKSIFGPAGIKDDTGTPQSDWKAIIDTGTLKTATGQQVGAGVTIIYTVPSGKVFYLIQASLSALDNGASAESNQMEINGNLGVFLRHTTPGVANQHFGLATGFPIPLKLKAGDTLGIRTGAGATAYGSIAGYELNG